MVKPKRFVTFVRISNITKALDTALGVSLLTNPAKKATFLARYQKWTLRRFAFLTILLLTSTILVTNFALISVILSMSVSSTCIALGGSLVTFIAKKDILKHLMKWCEDLYDVKKKYPKVVQDLAAKQLEAIEERTVKYLKWFRILLYTDAFLCTIGVSILGFFLPDTILPKFSLAIPMYLPFEDQKSWLAFITTTLLQTITTIDSANIALYLYSIFLCIVMHILGYLDIIRQAVEQMKREKDPTKFDEWIKIINDMINDANSGICFCANMYANTFMLTEIASLGTLFISGLIFTVIRKHQLYAVGVNIASILFFLMCYVNEKILDKLNQINEALYDIPWYNLHPKQMKALMMLMHCDKIQKGFFAAGVHPSTIERFGIVMKMGYTNLLVLKDLVKK